MSAGDVRIEELLARADWVRGLARHLAGQDGEDVLQDAWLAARRSPPDASKPANAWLARVLRNLVHLRRRNDARRARRERGYQAAQPDAAVAVDEVYERLELQRFLAEQVMALEDPLRTVVVLHYFEGLDSVRIGLATDAPPGTVRWRLKVALERLRAALDERHGGERRAWIALLAPPAADHGRGGLVMASVKAKATLLSGLLVVLLLLGGGAAWWWRRSVRSTVNTGATASAAVTVPGRPLPRLLRDQGARGADDLDLDLEGCRRALGPAQQLARAREREARGLVPAVAFAAGAPNPALRDELAAQLDPLLENGPLTRHIECRAWACRVALIVPNDGGGEVEPWLHSLGRWLPRLAGGLPGLTLGGPMPLGLAQQWGGGAGSADLLDGRKTEEFIFFMGAPTGAAADDGVEPGQLPGTLAACRRALGEARATARRLELQLAGFQPPPTAFGSAAAAPRRSTLIQSAVDEALGPGQATAECRGTWCRLHFSRPLVADTMARLRASSHLGPSLLGARRIDGDLYMLMRENAFGVLKRLREPMHESAFFRGCPDPAAPGSLLLRLAVPATGDVNDRGVPGRASVRAMGGSLADTPAAVCLVGRLEALLAVDLPAPINGAFRLERWTWRPGAEPDMETPE